MSLIYKEIDAAIEDAIIAQYGSWVRDYDCLVRGDGWNGGVNWNLRPGSGWKNFSDFLKFPLYK